MNVSILPKLTQNCAGIVANLWSVLMTTLADNTIESELSHMHKKGTSVADGSSAPEQVCQLLLDAQTGVKGMQLTMFPLLFQ